MLERKSAEGSPKMSVASAQPSPEHVGEERPEIETELPATPSAGVGRAMSVPLVEIKEETGEQACTSSTPVIFQPRWANIHEDSLLNNPLLRAE